MAWANEAFELWYLLHFDYHDTCISRDDYRKKLRQSGLEYDKADEMIFEKLNARQATALKFAHKLESRWNELGKSFPERECPSTSVHKLVEFLNELADLGSVD